MKKELKDLEIADLFHYYHDRANPFVMITTKVDITNIYNKCSNYYPSIAYFIMLAANRVDNFKYRYIDGKFYKYDKIKPGFTELKRDKQIGFFGVDSDCSYEEFMARHKAIKETFLETGESIANPEQDEVWLSCTPWFNFTSLVPPFDKSITIPQFIWDKFSFEGGRCHVNMFIMAHHGFVDGYHIGMFLQEFNDIVGNIDMYLGDRRPGDLMRERSKKS